MKIDRGKFLLLKLGPIQVRKLIHAYSVPEWFTQAMAVPLINSSSRYGNRES